MTIIDVPDCDALVVPHLAETLARLAATQQNLPVPLTVEERNELRAASKLLRRSRTWTL